MISRLMCTAVLTTIFGMPAILHAQEAATLDSRSDVRATERASLPTRMRKPWLHDKSFLLMSAGLYGGASLDMYATTRMKQWYAFSDPPSKLPVKFVDADPLARPVVNLPTPAYFTVGLALATGMNWVAWRLKHSERFKRIWWLPQAGQMTTNVYFGVTALCSRSEQIRAWKASRAPTDTGCH